MANRYLIAAGNSNDPAIYDGGTLPNSDDVLRLNNFAWTVVADITLAELRADALAPAVATNTERIVTLNNGVTLTCTTQVLGIAGPSAGMIRVASLGTATVVSPLLTRGISGVNSGETLNVIGLGDSTGLSVGGAIIRGSGTTNWTGGFVNPAQYIIDAISGGTVNITGNILQNGGSGVWARGNHTLNITGNVTNAAMPFYDTTTTTYNVLTQYGQLIAGSVPVIRSRSPYRGTGPFINNGSVCAFAGDRLELIPNGGTYIEAVTTTPTTVRLYTPDLLTGYPAEADVENGVVYGPSNEFTGTFEPANIDSFAEAFLAQIEVSAQPVAVRMRTSATVSTVNDAIASITVIAQD